MNAMYDVVCSVVIGGVVLSMLIGFNGNIAESAGSQTIKVIAQSNLTAVVSMLDNEFNKVGFRIGTQDSAIIYADSSKVTFISDLRNTGKIDTLSYSYDASGASGQLNKKTHILYRVLKPNGLAGGSTTSINLGITKFKFYYYNITGSPLTLPIAKTSLIKSMKVVLNVESTVPYKETTMKYLKLNPGVYWERNFKPMNLH